MRIEDDQLDLLPAPRYMNVAEPPIPKWYEQNEIKVKKLREKVKALRLRDKNRKDITHGTDSDMLRDIGENY